MPGDSRVVTGQIPKRGDCGYGCLDNDNDDNDDNDNDKGCMEW